MRVLVTGQSGLIGSHLVDRLERHEVFGISRSDANFNDNIKRYQIDLKDKEATAKVIAEIKPEIVFHCAANAAENKSVFSPIDITTNGVNTFYNVLVPSIKANSLKRFIFTSSIAVYGAIPVPFREADAPIPQDLYGVNKLAVEHALRIMADVHNFEHVIVRPHNVYGPRQNMTDPYRNVVTIFMNHLLQEKPYTIYGDGSMNRCFSWVGDVVDIIAKCGFEDIAGMTFNVGSDNTYSINHLSDVIQKTSGVKIEPKFEPQRVHEVHTAISDHTLVKKVFGYSETLLSHGVRRTWDWAKEQGAKTAKFTELELDNPNIPKNWKE